VLEGKRTGEQTNGLGMITDQVPHAGQAPEDESNTAHGALWITVGTVSIGLSNYGYSLLLTHLLTVTEYSVFSAGQGLILWATNIAAVSVPWVLAQALARARSDRERNSAIRFAKLLSAVTGIVAGLVAGGIAVGVSGPEIAVVVALSTFAIFLGTTTTGWLQGDERMRSLSLLYLAENVLKNIVGLLLVTVAGLKGVGALAGFGFGALAMLVRWPRTWRDGKQSWRQVVNKELLRTAMLTAGAQGLVSLFVAVDVVLVALLPGDRGLAASYQASTTLTRIPLYIAGAIATAYFPSLSRQSSNGIITAQAVRLYAAAGLPIMAILATVPNFFVTKLFPSQYGDVGLMLKYTAVTGLAAGGISLITTFFQAANEYSCLKWLSAGLAGYVIALLVGWRIAGVLGFAAGGALGSMIAFLLMGYLLVRRRGLVIFAWVRLLEPAVAGVALVLARAYWPIWLLAAFVFGLRAVIHFVRPDSRDEQLPQWATSRGAVIEQAVSATSLLIDAIWRGNVAEITDEELNEMLALGRANGVEGKLAQLYPTQLADVRTQVRDATYLYAGVLREAARRLRGHGIPAVLIEEGLSGFRSRGNIDLVIPRRYWWQMARVLPDKDSIYIQRTDRILFHPPAGPSIHIYPDLSWLGAQFLSTNRLIARALRTKDGILVPSRVDYLRVLLGNSLFQQRDLDLSQLFVLWGLMRSPVLIMTASIEAEREGWLHGFEDMLALVSDSINRLAQRQEITLPVHPPVLAPRRTHQSA
jgi:O-antigen/teichoic acid export membrane protein